MAGFSLGTNLRGFDVALGRFQRGVASVEGRALKALGRAGLLAEREIKRGLISGRPGGQKFKKLSPITKILRGGGRVKPLVRSGALGLLGAVTSKVDAPAKQAFAGVLRTSKNSDGESLVNIALIQEFGTKSFVIRVTEAMRGFFFWLHFKSGGKINPISPLQDFVLHPGIPARPFIRPVAEKIRPKIQKILRLALTENGGPL